MNITVAIPTWNRATLLAQTLDQLAALHVPADVTWEVLVVANCCTDRTADVVMAMAGRLPVRVLLEPRIGVSHARNCALAEAKGDYVIWTDDDVQMSGDWLAAYVEAFRRHPTASVFGGPIQPWFAQEPPPWLRTSIPSVGSAYGLVDFGEREMALSDSAVPYGANMAFRTSTQREIPFDAGLGRMGKKGVRRGAETQQIRALLSRGHAGVWVPSAPVRHYIPPEHMTTAYLRRYYYGRGQVLSLTTHDTGAKLFGRPRWALRSAVTHEVRYRGHAVVRADSCVDQRIATRELCVGCVEYIGTQCGLMKRSRWWMGGWKGVWRDVWMVGFASVLLVALTLAVSAHKTVGCDEGRALRTAWQTTLGGTLGYARWFEYQPPVYFALLHWWSALGTHTIGWVRLLSTLAALGAIVGVAEIARACVPAAGRMALPLLVAVSPAMLWAANESRVYALAICWVAWSLAFYARVWLRDDQTPVSRHDGMAIVGYIVASALAMLTFYYAGFILLGMGLAGVIWSRRRRGALIAADGALALLLVPFLSVIRSQIQSSTPDATAPVVGAAPGIAGSVTHAILTTMRELHIVWNAPLFDHPAVQAAIVFGIVALVAVRLRPGSPPISRVEWMVFVIALTPVVAIGVLDAWNLTLVRDRHRTILVLPVLVCLIVWAASLPPRRIGLTAVALVTALSLAMVVSYQRNRDPGLGWGAASAWIAATTHTASMHTEEPVLFTDIQCGTSFEYYHPATADIVWLPSPDPWGPLRPTDTVLPTRFMTLPRTIGSVSVLEARLAPVLRSGQTFWVVTQDATYALVGGAWLTDYLHAHADSVDARRFSGVTVSRWVRRPDAVP